MTVKQLNRNKTIPIKTIIQRGIHTGTTDYTSEIVPNKSPEKIVPNKVEAPLEKIKKPEYSFRQVTFEDVVRKAYGLQLEPELALVYTCPDCQGEHFFSVRHLYLNIEGGFYCNSCNWKRFDLAHIPCREHGCTGFYKRCDGVRVSYVAGENNMENDWHNSCSSCGGDFPGFLDKQERCSIVLCNKCKSHL